MKRLIVLLLAVLFLPGCLETKEQVKRSADGKEKLTETVAKEKADSLQKKDTKNTKAEILVEPGPELKDAPPSLRPPQNQPNEIQPVVVTPQLYAIGMLGQIPVLIPSAQSLIGVGSTSGGNAVPMKPTPAPAAAPATTLTSASAPVTTVTTSEGHTVSAPSSSRIQITETTGTDSSANSSSGEKTVSTTIQEQAWSAIRACPREVWIIGSLLVLAGCIVLALARGFRITGLGMAGAGMLLMIVFPCCYQYSQFIAVAVSAVVVLIGLAVTALLIYVCYQRNKYKLVAGQTISGVRELRVASTPEQVAQMDNILKGAMDERTRLLIKNAQNPNKTL